MNKKVLNIIYLFLPVLSILTLVLAYISLASMEGSLFPPLQSIGERFVNMLFNPVSKATLLDHIWISMQRVLAAFGIAIVTGIGLGILLGWSPTLGAIVSPVFELLRPIPPIAWIPLVILWFGIGESAKIVIVFIGAFIPIVINTQAGITTIDPLIVNAGKVLGANYYQLLFNVVLPAIVPAILAGIKTSLSVGWACVLAAEMIAAKQGLGALIVRGQETSDMAQIVVCMLAIGVVSAALSFCLTKLEGVLCPWQFKRAKLGL